MENLHKLRTSLIFIYLIIFISIIFIFDFFNIYGNTIFNQFEIQYINSDSLIEPELVNFKNLLFLPYNKNNPIQKRGLNTYCLISIENINTNEIALVEKGNCSTINLFKVEEDNLQFVKRIENKHFFDTSPFFIVTLENTNSAQYILEYQDKNANYIYPRIVDINTWYKDYKIEIAGLSFLKQIIGILFIYILIKTSFQIVLKKRKLSNYFKSVYFNQAIKIILINLLIYIATFVIESLYNFSNGIFFVITNKYIIFFAILFSLFEYLLIYHLYIKNLQKREVEALSKELEQIKELNFDKILNIDNYSKTIALENLGKLFLFFDGELAFLNSINQTNYAEIIEKLKVNINNYKIELKESYEYLLPTNRINEAKINYYISENNQLKLENEITIGIYDNDAKNIYNYSSILSENNINSLKLNDEDKIIELILKNEIHLLLINPYSTGKRSKELCSKIRQIKPYYEFPIIMMNKFCSFFYINEFRDLEINDFIMKPIEVNELIIRIKNLIYQKDLYSKNNELRTSEREKNTFLYFITHNVNTPLTILINQINDLSLEEKLPKEMMEDVEEIRITSEEINQIIQNVLAAFRLNDGNFINVPQLLVIRDIMNNIMKSSNSKAKNKNQKIIWQVNTLPNYITFDRTAIRGILTNLIDNAIKYSPYDSTIYINTKRNNNHLIIDVINEGAVIKDSEIDLLFCENTTISTKPTGGEISLGLGLNTSFKLTKLNKSELTYKKTIELKNLFSLKIPLNLEDDYA